MYLANISATRRGLTCHRWAYWARLVRESALFSRDQSPRNVGTRNTVRCIEGDGEEITSKEDVKKTGMMEEVEKVKEVEEIKKVGGDGDGMDGTIVMMGNSGKER